ncbi:MAG: type I-E CRISPR-associated protein Cas7/Cse4/CasC [Clostridiales Family XIII bacterium]|jgi:CRISPR system Cascade subunit CasC|nr:type I-E CRISPR-associated protein Cas7/Cse4/CasC [Clostridiales Family XIII bacterium]
MHRTIIDFHVIQTVPPSNINRDDTGSPKSAIYGGVRRARVSSQAWKKAIRSMFREHFAEEELAMRTKKIVDLVAKEIRKADADISEGDAMNLAEKAINATGVKTKDKEAQALFFLSATQAASLGRLAAEAARNGVEIDKTAAKEALNRKEHSVEIALFGRMVADDPSLNADAAAQVAHGISVHKVENEYDFYTAVDDVKERDEAAADAGAGMLGTIEFNSSTLYRYATVFADLLYEELANDADVTAKAVSEFARGFIASMPTGKQNSFANHTPPYAALVTIREDRPLNFVGAFEKPVEPSGEGFARGATQKLADHAGDIYRSFAKAPLRSYIVALDDAARILAEQKNQDGGACERVDLDGLTKALASEVQARVGGASGARPESAE